MITVIPFRILLQYMWYNADIQVDKTSIHFLRFFEKNIKYVSQLCNSNGSIKNGIRLRENTIYIRILIFNGYNDSTRFQKNGNLSFKKTMKLQLILSLMIII